MRRLPKNAFDLSHDVKLSFNPGELVPVLCMDCIPGDRFKLGADTMVRFQPLVFPVMHRANVSMHYFFVPYRILWPNWSNWITRTKVNDEVPAFPTMTLIHDETLPRVLNYLGLPKPSQTHTQNEVVSAMQAAAYQCVYNEYYRDENLVPSVNWQLVDGDNGANTDLVVLRQRAWEHDYFTSALPFAQKGDAVLMPTGAPQDIPVYRNTPTPTAGTTIDTLTGPDPLDITHIPADSGTGIGSNRLYADTSNLLIDAPNINDLRRATALQRFYERLARGGSRLTEFIWSMFGEKSPDGRLQRPEYIVGDFSPVVISEVLNTTGTDEAPQGAMAGHGFNYSTGKLGSFRAPEHGLIIGVMSCMPKTAYQQGIPKQFLQYTDSTDYFTPDFANIGEQAIDTSELYAYTTYTGETFGYIPRYSQYRYMPSRVAGQLADNTEVGLSPWHWGRIFQTPPALNQTFIDANPSSRIFAVEDPSQDRLIAQVVHKITRVSIVPKYGTPSF